MLYCRISGTTPAVLIQSTVCSKRFTTALTGIWLLSRVNPFVCNKRPLLCKTFSTILTTVISNAKMWLFVGKHGGRLQYFTTNVTFDIAISYTNTHRTDNTGWKSFIDILSGSTSSPGKVVIWHVVLLVILTRWAWFQHLWWTGINRLQRRHFTWSTSLPGSGVKLALYTDMVRLQVISWTMVDGIFKQTWNKSKNNYVMVKYWMYKNTGIKKLYHANLNQVNCSCLTVN